ncbi:putative fructose-bisphosphate aldolase glycosomal [Trypanosoma theileri]|uniref:fructose-bisphosphate aldolase n=1 Tax=Trypanosoma theileri TaxID=67003 RepID=A0A1X0NPL7_9TRYP|nr:putative fructose-bisphosphate aldolase glycosomal [Trypanosoma theileri]ORC86645.1 putative fructose-bisphosphate aldolase glycosomal [Trypanosoma theileri]
MSKVVQVLQGQLPSYNRIRTKYEAELISTAAKMAARGKGILAADEPIDAYNERFKPMGLENNVENRRKYRVILLETPGMEEYISGVILHKETVEQQASTGETFPHMLMKKGIVCGINTDGGLHPFFEGVEGEEMTEGLDGYAARAASYYAKGCRFCKWRNVYRIQNDNVSEALVRFNAETLARYAVLSQMNGLVPIVEPEIMLNGTHNIHTCEQVSQHVWSEVIAALHRHGVILEGIMLKPSMVVPGSESGITVSAAEVAAHTVATLARVLPPAVPVVGFLSGGLSELQSTEYLNAINNTSTPHTWLLTFTFGRALQNSALKAWVGKDENIPHCRRTFMHRAKMNSLAVQGKYKPEMEKELH